MIFGHHGHMMIYACGIERINWSTCTAWIWRVGGTIMVPTMRTSLFSPMIIIGMVLSGVITLLTSVTTCSSMTTIVGGGFFLIRVLGSSLGTFRLVSSVGAIRVIRVITQFRGIISHVVIIVPRTTWSWGGIRSRTSYGIRAWVPTISRPLIAVGYVQLAGILEVVVSHIIQYILCG